jgi:hypothetical protein
MSYKNQFRPIEGLSRGEWRRLAWTAHPGGRDRDNHPGPS